MTEDEIRELHERFEFFRSELLMELGDIDDLGALQQRIRDLSVEDLCSTLFVHVFIDRWIEWMSDDCNPGDFDADFLALLEYHRDSIDVGPPDPTARMMKVVPAEHPHTSHFSRRPQ